MPDVVRRVDGRHAAASELALEHVAVAQGFGKRVWQLGNGAPPDSGSERGICRPGWEGASLHSGSWVSSLEAGRRLTGG
jgi:hypothetical protein